MAKEKWFLTGISNASIKRKSLKEKEKKLRENTFTCNTQAKVRTITMMDDCNNNKI